MTTSRAGEAQMLNLCFDLALGRKGTVQSAADANLARFAGSVLRSRLPQESARLKAAAEEYFSNNPETTVSFDEAFDRGWVTSLPRLRDMLSEKLRDFTAGSHLRA
ncbi:hypothetical protein [Hydrogenophaga sp. 2FB]|uniref:hypothetical protein n=1 Tax=Hydrogenophaga sp. 2FB TaxID=2502187 RepID=UPI0010F73025|nr:hypothetical protein [Hydrogenophaga sp. 2FB]